MAKTKKKLASDIKVGDTILLDKPEVIVLSKKPAKKKYRRSPEGAIVIEIEDVDTGKVSEILALEDTKLELVKRPSRWDNFKKWLEQNHAAYQHKRTITRIEHKTK
jgi:hypothetical protein